MLRVNMKMVNIRISERNGKNIGDLSSYLILSSYLRVDTTLTEILRLDDILAVRNIQCESNDDIRIRLYYSLVQITN
jgi:hypothetical protein